MNKHLFATVIALMVVMPVFAQLTGKYFINSYDRTDYDASISNWRVIQDQRGVIYFANFDGILKYQGNTWSLISADKNECVTYLEKDKDNKIYVGTLNDFGFLKPNQGGLLEFTSLREELPKGLTFGRVRWIGTVGSDVYFCSAKSILKWNGHELSGWNAGEGEFNLTPVIRDGDVYCIHTEKGWLKLAPNGLVHIDKEEFPSQTEYSRLVKKADTKEAEELILRSGQNFYWFRDGKYHQLSEELTSYLIDGFPTDIISVPNHPDRAHILGITDLGIVITDSLLNPKSVLGKYHGLNEKSTRGICIDNNNNLWSAMRDGAAHLELFSGWRYWDKSLGMEGTNWGAIKMDGRLYSGTSEGLFYREKGRFEKLDQLKGKIWSQIAFPINAAGDSVILVGSSSGLHELSGLSSKLTSLETETTALSNSKFYENTFFVGHFEGLDMGRYVDGEFRFTNIIRSVNSTYYSIAEDDQGNIWASDKFKGVYRVSGIRSGAPQVRFYNEKDGLPDVREVSILNHKGKMLFTTDQGFYRFEESSGNNSLGSFVEDRSLLDERVKINTAIPDGNGNYYVVIIENREERLEKLVPDGNGGYKRIYKPFRRLPEMEIQSVYTKGDGIVWISGSSGLFRYDENAAKDLGAPFNTLISKVTTTGDSAIFHGTYYDPADTSLVPSILLDQPDSFKPKMPYASNTMIFDYTATSYEVPEKTQFSYLLNGSDKSWSAWSLETRKEYTHLPPGDYVFHVRSKNIYDNEGRVASYAFTILPAWYQTVWARLIFMVLIVLGVWSIALMYSYRVRTQRRKLKLVVADRTFEVLSQKKEIELQHSLLKERSDKILQQRDYIKLKNAALERSQSEILKMNQRLQEMNAKLEETVQLRTSKINDTLEELQQTHDELDTFVYRASHDLKAPVSRISGLVTLAKMELKEGEEAQYYDLIELAAREMKDLLAKLATVHEIFNKQVEQEEVNLSSMISEVWDASGYLRKDVEVNFDLDIDSSTMIKTDVYLLLLLLESLLHNALIFRKNKPEAEINIKVSSLERNGVFYLKIWDSGIGIHQQQYDKIYDMFFRGSEQSRGSGLGLYLAKIATQKLEGKISVYSELGVFTEFIIAIPMK